MSSHLVTVKQEKLKLNGARKSRLFSPSSMFRDMTGKGTEECIVAQIWDSVDVQTGTQGDSGADLVCFHPDF